ncbi:head maturation protease, ClpP-related [Flexibacterium corallicola]|uniref:head maturation protease, ClpP-related n=1 Tax=Flexibacterium corallicola TaxID=3037259 RepID=UPI00286F1B54|nr:head maturation protease, ClpP-related [Pseudovibrio sp. M1P-2-3]
MTLKTLPEITTKGLQNPQALTFEPDADALSRWVDVKAAKTDTSTISILTRIGPNYDNGITPSRIAAALRTIGKKPVTVDINSPGGSFFDGVAIYNQLRAHPEKVTVRVLGVAASAASIIAMAGDEILVGKQASMMIHCATGVAVGNKRDMRKSAETLDVFDKNMVSVYRDKTGKSSNEISELLDAETWFNGEEAVEFGLADALLPASALTKDPAQPNAKMKAVEEIEAALMERGLSQAEARDVLGLAQGAAPVSNVSSNQDDELTEGLQDLLASLK